ncbi:MAG: hypothetical protein CVT88_00465 [Candidatus Altiarchaeales archaeon HGW-Altiarchaeales-1]|nr:MAG: hypothetical protein CVT88_00465 [Candidatus Altiarchaeales archaeon HGW-Altiarchaeales-1]
MIENLLEDKKGLQLISIIAILVFALLLIILPDFWPIYLLLALALIIFVERKFRAKWTSDEEREKETFQLKDDLKNKRISDEELLKLAAGDKSTRLAIAEGLSENFAQFSVSAVIIGKFSEDADEYVRDAALYAFRQNLFKFLNPGDVFEKFLKADNYGNCSCAHAMKLLRIMKDNFEKISPYIIEQAIVIIAKSDLKTNVGLAKSIANNALGMGCCALDVKTELADFIGEYFNRIENKTDAINLLIENTLKIEAENEEADIDFIVRVAVCLEKCNKNEYTKISIAQNFVERFSRSMNENIAKSIAKITDKNFENIKNLAVILENLAYSQSGEVKEIVRKNLREDMENYDEILKILET